MAVRNNKQKNHHLRVLLVDDNENGLAARKMLLEELGLETVGVNSPKRALEAMEGGEFDLVVTDYQMPGLNGTQLIAAMRARGVQAPVIMVSGYVEALSLTEKSTGANLVIAKSAHEVAALLRGVKRLLPGSPMRKPAGRTGAKPKHRSASA